MSIKTRSCCRFESCVVAAPGFIGLDPFIPDVWEPLSANPGELRIIGRLRPGVTGAQAQAALSALLPRITESRPQERRLVDARLESRATYQDWNHADPANVLPVVTPCLLILLIALRQPLERPAGARVKPIAGNLGPALARGQPRPHRPAVAHRFKAEETLAAVVSDPGRSRLLWTIVQNAFRLIAISVAAGLGLASSRSKRSWYLRGRCGRPEPDRNAGDLSAQPEDDPDRSQSRSANRVTGQHP